MGIVEQQTHARPYAEAAFRFAKQESAVQGWSDFVSTFADLFSNDTITPYLNTPFIDQLRIVEVINTSLPKSLSATQLNFLKLLAESKRLVFMPAVSRYFNELQDEDNGTLRVHATSAFALDEATYEALRKKLSARFKKIFRWKRRSMKV